MKPSAIAFIVVVVCATTAAVSHDWNPVDDDKLIQAVVAAALNQEHANISRVTESTFKMADPTAALCNLPSENVRHSPHKEYYCHVYVNEPALKSMSSGEGAYPEGSLIIKQKYSDQRGVNTELFTVMRKMAKGYDTANNNWEYSIVDGSARTVLSRGRTDSCINCHADYAATDYVTRLYMSQDHE